jgi:hypothetical protein
LPGTIEFSDDVGLHGRKQGRNLGLRQTPGTGSRHHVQFSFSKTTGALGSRPVVELTITTTNVSGTTIASRVGTQT